MPGQDLRTLDTLRLERSLLDLGVYRISTPGRPLVVFEDSPSCQRYATGSCAHCALMQFVPPNLCSEPVPCHHIPLNEQCETVDILHRTGTQEELEQALRSWLTATIKRFEAGSVERRSQ